ncbi:hypothetical protein JVU11DRAFT_8249 [Chiua virens]|nr:hypothetical protein JVU11DRAFT_8249 [Chiua virens]
MVSSLITLPIPRCHNMQELLSAVAERARIQDLLARGDQPTLEAEMETNPLSKHLLHGLAYTTGSALGSDPPTRQECLSAFTASATNSGLTAGAKAWSKHAHRSGDGVGWWGGQPKGPVATINGRARVLFDKVMDDATWRNLHWLPHQVLVYEVRVSVGYGMRWSQENGCLWMFRGFVEPMMDNGHELGWKH